MGTTHSAGLSRGLIHTAIYRVLLTNQYTNELTCVNGAHNFVPPALPLYQSPSPFAASLQPTCFATKDRGPLFKRHPRAKSFEFLALNRLIFSSFLSLSLPPSTPWGASTFW